MLFALIFVILLPMVILYSGGWRFKSGYGFVITGGIFVEVPYPDAIITLNSKEVGRSGFLQRGFYIGNLAPSAYVVRVDRTGYRPWGRILVVEPKLVTDTRALVIPEHIELSRLAVTGTASSTRIVSRTVYDSYLAAFATTTAIASSTIALDESGGIGLFLKDGDIMARWQREDRSPPSIFCSSPSFCSPEIPVKREGGAVLSVRFFHGGVVYRTREGSIYFAEVDIRPTPVSAQLFSAKDADMRVVGDALIVKSGNVLYEVEGL